MSEPTKLDPTMICYGSAAPPAADRTPLPKHRPAAVGRYTIVRELGRGGMGVVYEGYDARLKRPVAVKMILRDDGDPETRARFQTEAEAVAQLHHPNIVQIFEVGRDADRPFVAFEFLPGGSLVGRTQGKPQPPRAAAGVVRDLAEAMAHAHAAGVVHRDLKPANILFDATGRPKVTDFGAARVNFGPASAEPGSSLTRVGEIIGTPQYMAPEQARGGADAAAPCVDVYALGAILYTQLTGRAPFDAPDPFDVLTAVVNQDPVPPRRLQPSVPRDLETVCLKALAKQPAKRYRTAAELAEDLGRFLNGQTVRAKPASAAEKLVKRARRQPVEFALTAALIVVSAVGLAGVVVQWQAAVAAKDDAMTHARAALDAEAETRTANGRVTANLKAVETEKAAADAARNRAETMLSRSRVATAALEWEKGQVDRARAILENVRPDDRQWEWHHLRRTFDGYLWATDQPFTDRGEWLYRAGVSPDGRRVAYVAKNAYEAGELGRLSLYVLDAATGRVLSSRLRVLRPDIQDLYWLDADQFVTVSWIGNACVWAADRATPPRTAWDRPDLPDGIPARGLAAGRWALRSGDCGQIESFDLVAGTPGPVFPRTGAVPLMPAVVCPAANRAVVVEYPGAARTVSVLDLAAGTVLRELPGVGYAAALTPDGATVLTVGRDDDRVGFGRTYLQATDVASGRILWRHGSAGWDGRDLAVTADGRHLIEHLRGRNELRIWTVADGTGGRAVRGGVGQFERFALSPDGQYVAAVGVDNGVRVWTVSDGQLYRQYAGHRHNIKDVTFDPTGRVLITAGTDGRTVAWDLSAERPGARLALPATRDYYAASTVGTIGFTADGRLRMFHTVVGSIDIEPRTGERLAVNPIPEGYRRIIKELNDWAFDAGARIAVGPVHPPDRVFLAGTRLAAFDAATGTRLREFEPAPENVAAVAVSADGTRAAAACADSLRSTQHAWVCVWDVATGAILHRRSVRVVSVALALSPDGRKLAYSEVVPKAGGSHRFTEWDLETGACVPFAMAEPAHFSHLLYRGDGAKIAGIGGRGLVVFDAATRREEWSAATQSLMTGLAFSPDGRRLAGTGYTDVVTLWDTDTGAEVYTLVGATGRWDDLAFPARVAFSVCGKHLAANHWDGAVSVWSLDDWDVPADSGAAAHRGDAAAAAYTHHLREFTRARHAGSPYARAFHAAFLNAFPAPSDIAREDYRRESKLTLEP